MQRRRRGRGRPVWGLLPIGPVLCGDLSQRLPDLGKGSSLPLQPLVTVMVTTRSKPVLGSLSFPEMVSLGPALILGRGKCSRHRDRVREVELPVTGSVTRGFSSRVLGSEHPQPWPSGLWGQLGSV